MAIMDEPGLRERKKKHTRDELQRVANRLFRDRGYHDVTIDQIVAEANVSHRTFYRYFDSKEDLVLGDVEGMLEMLTECLEARPDDESVLESIRAATSELSSRLADDEEDSRLRARLIRCTPDLHQRSIERQPLLEAALVPFVARKLGLDPDEDLRPRVFAACAMAAAGVGIEKWAADPNPPAPTQYIDEALELLAAGFGPDFGAA